MNVLIRSLATVCAERLLDEKWLVAPSLRVGYQWLQSLARGVYDRLRENSPHIRAHFNRRFTHLLVNEFQDTDPIQAEVMLLLSADDPNEADWRTCRPRPGVLFVVGDPKQSIYRSRRADLVTYNEVKAIVHGAGGAVAEHYRPQLEAYAHLWQQSVGAPVKEIGLYFTRVHNYTPLK